MNEKMEYIKKLESQFSEAQTIIDRLKGEERERAQHEEIERLEEYLERSQVRIKDIYKAAGEAWQQLREEIDELLHNLSESLKKVRHK